MMPSLNLQILKFLLPLSLWTSTVVALGSGFNIKAHGTGLRNIASGSLSADNVGVLTSDDLSYTVDIVIGGESFTVLLDTGSSDLWVSAQGRNIQLTNTTDIVAAEGYGSGEAQGTISFAEVQIGDFMIESQVFIAATELEDFDLTGYDGIMGMAFDVASIYETLEKAWGSEAADEFGRAPITSLFAQNQSLANNFDVQLGRTSELEDVAEGTFLISAHATGYENVTSAPQLPRVSSEHWSVVMDNMLVNGEAFSFNASRIDGVPSGKIVAALDTGFSFPPLPAAAVDAIYGSIPGAAFTSDGQLWLVPCDTATNLSFVFAGQEFPVHPLDLTWPTTFTLPINGTETNVTACINTYQYLTLDPNSFTGFDIILGDAFLRNVYASFDYGDDTPSNHSAGTPFVQMISTTDVSTMWEEFQTERAATLAQLPPALDPSVLVQLDQASQSATSSSSSSGASPASSSQSSGDTDNFAVAAAASSSDDNNSSSDDSWSKKYGMVVLGLLAANLVVGFAVFVVALTLCVRGMKGRSVGSRYVPVKLKETGDADYERGPHSYTD